MAKKTTNELEDKAPEVTREGKPAKTAGKAEAQAKTETKAAKTAPKGEKKAAKPRKEGAGKKRNPLMPQTPYVKWGMTASSRWRHVDATGIPLGRLSSYIAVLLMGKDQPQYTRHADSGDFVVVTNANKVVLTGNKWEQKTYYWHTQYPGGIKSITAKDLLKKNPERLVEWAVYGMLPKYKGPMVRRWHGKLMVYANAEHPHKAQKPETVKLPNLGLN